MSTVPATHHLVLVTYGEPPTEDFVDQLVYSWRILLGLTRRVAAIPPAVLPLIAVARARSRRRLWRAQGYGSPLEAITIAQADRLTARLREDDAERRWRVHVAYEYRRPLVRQVVRALPAGDAVWLLPLYAADSAFTHALAREAVGDRSGPTHVLGALAPDQLGAIAADHVRGATQEQAWHGADVALVLAAHGTVLDPPTPIDTGLAATEALCREIATRLASHFGLVVNGWLNHTRGGRWTEPPIEQALKRVADAGFGRVVYYPYGFLADNAESELEGRLALAGTPLEARHLPCLNASTTLIALVVAQLRRCATTCRRPHGEGLMGPRCRQVCATGAPLAGACELCAVSPARS